MNLIIHIIMVLGLTALTSVDSNAQALSKEGLQFVKRSVIEVCRGGTIEGKSHSFEIKGEGNTKVLILRGLADLGIEGAIQFTQEEWQGIKAIIPEKWNQAEYNQCVDKMVNVFVSNWVEDSRTRSGKIKAYEDKPAKLCGEAAIRVVIYRDTARRAKQEALLISDEINDGKIKLQVGQSTSTMSNCTITLSETGYDRDFYAWLEFSEGFGQQ